MENPDYKLTEYDFNEIDLVMVEHERMLAALRDIADAPRHFAKNKSQYSKGNVGVIRGLSAAAIVAAKCLKENEDGREETSKKDGCDPVTDARGSAV